jgi:hypothetical protein
MALYFDHSYHTLHHTAQSIENCLRRKILGGYKIDKMLLAPCLLWCGLHQAHVLLIQDLLGQPFELYRKRPDLLPVGVQLAAM